MHAEVPDNYVRVGFVAAERVHRQGAALVARALGWWVERARRLAWAIVLAAVAVSALGGIYTARHLGIDTDSDALLSADLPYRKTLKAFEQAFPALGGDLVVLVEGDSPDRAEDAANALVGKFREQPSLFGNIFFPAGEAFFRREGLLFLDLKELQELSDRLAQAQPLLGTLVEDASLRGLFGVLGEAAGGVEDGEVDAGLLVHPLNAIADAVAARLEGKVGRLSWRDLMTGLPDRPSDRREIILLKPPLDYKSLSPAADAIKAIHGDAAALGLDAAHGVSVRVTGSPALAEDDLRSVKNGVGVASLLSLALVSVIVVLGLRSPRLVFATLATLLLSLVWTASFAALAIGYLNMISVAFAVLFIGLAVDFSIQFALRYKESVDGGAALAAALGDAAKGTGVAVSLAALCAAIGFFSFVPTDYVGLSQLGIIAGVGMFIGLFATLTLLPAFITVMPMRRGAGAAEERNGGRVAAFLERHARAICLVALALGLVALAAFPLARFDVDPINLKNPDTESVEAYRDMTRDSTISPYSISVVEPSLAEADAVAKRLDRLPEVDSTVTLSSFIPQEQEAKLALIDQMATFLTPLLQEREPKAPPSGAERQAAAASLEEALTALAASPKAAAAGPPAKRLAELLARFAQDAGRMPGAYSELETALVGNLRGRLDSLLEVMQAGPVSYGTLPQDLKARYIAPDGRARIEVFPTANLSDESALRRFVRSVQAVAPNATDAPVELLEGGKLVVGAFEKAGVIALIAIGILLLLVLRSLVDSLLVLLPLMLAAALTVAFVVVTGQAFNFANVIALPLLFSLGVAFGIYLVFRHRETRRVANLLRTSTPRAVLFSALTTMVSFSSLMVSSHRGTASMGRLLGICLSLALVCTLVVLPALLTWREQRRRTRAAPR